MDIEEFPGILERSKMQGTPYILDEAQKAWFEKYFPIMSDKDLSKAMGFSYTSVRRFAEKIGITKDRNVMRRRFSKIQKELLESERRKERWCIERKTKIYIPRVKYNNEQLRRRWNAVKKFGYILADDYSDKGGHRYVIYYDQHTTRNKRFEKYSLKYGFTFKKWSDETT